MRVRINDGGDVVYYILHQLILHFIFFFQTYDPETGVRNCDSWRAKTGTHYSNVIRNELGNAATKLLTPAMCRSLGIDIPDFPGDVLVELYKHGDEYLLRIVNPCGLSEHLGYKDGITAVDTKGRGGNKSRKSGVQQMLSNLKGMGFTLTELDKDVVTETNDRKVSQMLKDKERVIYLKYIGDGPKPSPDLTRKEVYNQYVSTDNEGGYSYSTRVADYVVGSLLSL